MEEKEEDNLQEDNLPVILNEEETGLVDKLLVKEEENNGDEVDMALLMEEDTEKETD